MRFLNGAELECSKKLRGAAIDEESGARLASPSRQKFTRAKVEATSGGATVTAFPRYEPVLTVLPFGVTWRL